MTPKISLITAIVGVALVFGVAAAWADNHPGARRDEAARISPDLVELVTSKNGVVDSSLVKALSNPLPIRGQREPFSEGASSNPATSSNTGSEIVWSQLGIGFGMGMVLALGLVLGLWYTRARPLAH